MDYSKYDLFIFDLDDTLIKTEYYHYISWKTVLNTDFRYEYFISRFHSNKENNIQSVLSKEYNIQDCNAIIEEKKTLYLRHIDENKKNIKMIDGIEDLLNQIIEAGKLFVIVSNSPKLQIDYYCELFPILKKSTKNYYSEMFQRKKPNAECYLNVSLDFPNKKMVGFEDSITGIHSMTQVEEIDTVFINNLDYYYYDYILENYNIKSVIINYIDIKI
jgi:beta-phosphoglucomutase-like phosphatase (HAD superfamily)